MALNPQPLASPSSRALLCWCVANGIPDIKNVASVEADMYHARRTDTPLLTLDIL